MFTFEVNKNNIELTESETVTSGSVNVYFCHFIFSSDWDGLAKTITFRAGDVSVSILLDSTNMCTIPWEVLQTDAVQLYCGARGTVTAADTEEEAVIPTVYCLLGTIRKGTELGENAQPPAPSVVDQIMARIEALDEGKQDKLIGQPGQIVSFDEFGNVITREEKGTEYKAGENISISADNTISAKMYDDTEIRAEIGNIKTATEKNAADIAANAGAIAANSEAITKNESDITKNKTDIAKNTADISANAANIAKNSADIAKNTAGLKTVGDKVDTLNTSFSALSKSVTDNTAAINTAEENIAALSLSVTEAGREIAENASGLSAANTKISELESSKQDKLRGVEGQVVGFDAEGNAIAQDGGAGTPGEDGVTFTPMVSPEGVISWTNDGGRENPEAVNIKGPKGDPGTYTAGANIEISEDNVISAKTYDDTALKADIAKNTASINSMKADISANTSAIEAANTNISDISSSLQSVKSDISANTSAIASANANISGLSESKQDKLSGSVGQVVSFDENGNVISRDENVTEYKAGENISISADNTISAAMYNDTEIRGEINSVKSKTEANASNIAKNTADINKNAEAITENAANIAKNTAGIKTVSDKVDTLTSSLSTLSKSVTDNTTAINKANTDISALSSSVTAAEGEIAKNTTGLSAANTKISALEASKQNKLSGTAGQVVGFDAEGNAVAQEGGVDGVTFTPAVSEEGIISWTNDGGRENPSAVNIKGQKGDPGNNGITPHIGDNGNWYIGTTDTGVSAQGPQGDPGPAGTYSAGAGIAISNDTIALKGTASTKYQAGTATVSGFGGFNNFTLNSQTSEISSIVEYLKTSSSGGEGAITFRTMYGYAEVSFSANRSTALSPASALRILMSESVSYKGAAGFAIIDHGGAKYIALVYADSNCLYVYPTQTISISSGDALSIQLFVH